MMDREPCPTCGSTGYCILAGERGAKMHPPPEMKLPPPHAAQPALLDETDEALVDRFAGFIFEHGKRIKFAESVTAARAIVAYLRERAGRR